MNAAPHALESAAAALLGILAGALALAIAITVLPVLRKFSERMALSFIAMGSVALALAAVESGTMMSLLSLSKAYVESGADRGIVRRAARSRGRIPQLGALHASRDWRLDVARLLHRAVRFALVPRALAAFGLLACRAADHDECRGPSSALQVVFFLLAPLGLANLAWRSGC